jgi:hypothetical protein
LKQFFPLRPWPEAGVGIDVASAADVHEAASPSICEILCAIDLEPRVVIAGDDDSWEWQLSDAYRSKSMRSLRVGFAF